LERKSYRAAQNILLLVI